MSKTRLTKSAIDQSLATRHACDKVLVARPDKLCERLLDSGIHLISQYVADRQRLLTQQVLSRSELVEMDSYTIAICPAAGTPLRRGTGPLSGADPDLRQAVESAEGCGLVSVMSYVLLRDRLIDLNRLGVRDAQLLDDHVFELSENWPKIEVVGAVKAVFNEDGRPELRSLH